MQVIARSANEGLVIGDDIVVTVLEIHSKFVRLGIETPNRAPFYREEVLHYGDDDGNWLATTDCEPSNADPLVLATAL